MCAIIAIGKCFKVRLRDEKRLKNEIDKPKNQKAERLSYDDLSAGIRGSQPSIQGDVQLRLQSEIAKRKTDGFAYVPFFAAGIYVYDARLSTQRRPYGMRLSKHIEKGSVQRFAGDGRHFQILVPTRRRLHQKYAESVETQRRGGRFSRRDTIDQWKYPPDKSRYGAVYQTQQGERGDCYV